MSNGQVVARRKAITVIISVSLLGIAYWIFGAGDFLIHIGRFPLWAIATIVALFAINLLVVSFRLWRILNHFGIPLPPGAALQASIAGQVGSQLVISLLGQVVGRQLVLQRFQVPPALVASLTGYERVVLAVVSGALCLIGAVVLLGKTVVEDFMTRMPLLDMIIVVGCALSLSLWLGHSRFESKLAASGWSARSAARVLEISGITLTGQMFVLAAFVVAILTLKPDSDLLGVFSAAAVISFAASIPVTVNGWGVRELAAVYMLGHIGIPSSAAFAASILVGLSSTVVALGAAPFVMGKTRMIRLDVPDTSRANTGLLRSDIEKAGAWIIASATAVLVFFQAHISFQGSAINLNLADPFALLALAVVLSQLITTRQPPIWRTRHINVALAALSVLIVIAFLHGTQEIGVTQWALAGRLIGWVVILGYLSAGYIMAAKAGTHGLRRMFETMIATGAVIVVVQVLLRLSGHTHLLAEGPGTPNFEGYAANRNAFAFQMLVCSTLILAYSSVQTRLSDMTSRITPASNDNRSRIGAPIWRALGPPRLWSFSVLHGVVLAGLVFSASRAGLITGIVLLLVAWVSRLGERRPIVQSMTVAVFIWLLVWLLSGVTLGNAVQGPLSTEVSDSERWETITRGLDLWLQHPLFGAGLGVFAEKSRLWIGHQTVIHNTPIWILAEFGILGAAVIFWTFYTFSRYALRATMRSMPAARAAAMLLASFALFSLAHEILYQRMFWLVLGAVLALPNSGGKGNPHN